MVDRSGDIGPRPNSDTGSIEVERPGLCLLFGSERSTVDALTILGRDERREFGHEWCSSGTTQSITYNATHSPVL